MNVCQSCGESGLGLSGRCRACHEPLAQGNLFDLFLVPERAIGIAAEFAIFGGLLMAVGPFLPFAEVSGAEYQGPLSAGVESVPMVCAGAVATVFGVLSLVLRRRFAHWYLPCAAATVAMTFYCQMMVENRLMAASLTSSTWGLGTQFCYLGALLSLIAGAVCLAQRPIVPLRQRLAGAASTLVQTSFRPRPRSEVVTYWEALRRKRRN